MLSVLVLGAGTMGKTHIRAYQKMKNVKLAGVVDISQPEFPENNQLQFFSTFEEAIAKLDGIDAVDICLPTFLHKEYAKKAAVLGKHIICEKPLARTLEDSKEILNVCKENNVKLFVGHVVRFFPEYKQAKDIVDSGMIGKPEFVRMTRNSRFPESWNDWYSNKQRSGGLILDLIIHDIDFLRWCFGDVKSVNAKSLHRHKYPKKECALVTLHFENGVTAQVEGSWSHEKFATKFEFTGDKGKMEFDSSKENHLVTVAANDQSDKDAGIIHASHAQVSPYYEELAHFAACIENDEEPILTPDDAYEAVRISLAAIKSMEMNQPVSLNECVE